MTDIDRLADRHDRLLARYKSTFGAQACDKVVFVADPTYLQSFAGQVAWATTLNLAARLYRGIRQVRLCLPPDIARRPHVYFPNDERKLLDASLRMLEQLNPGCFEVEAGAPLAPEAGWVWVRIGGDARDEPHAITIAGRGWLGCVGDNAWTTLPDDENPIGPMIAACLGVAELYKALYPPKDYSGPAPHRFSAHDYSDPTRAGPSPGPASLPRTHIAGAGAVGLAFLLALSSCPWLSGSENLRVVDYDDLEDTNLNRCVLAVLSDLDLRAEKGKVVIALRELTRQGFTPAVYPETWQAYAARPEYTDDCDFDLVVSCVDKYEARMAVQYARMPKLLLTAGTGDFLVTVSRHVLDDGLACGLCHQSRDPDTGCATAGESARSAFTGDPDPSISFVSALAGVLLAAEYLKEINPAWSEQRVANAVRVNALRGSGRPLARTKDPSCNCASKYVAAGYRTIWGNSRAAVSERP